MTIVPMIGMKFGRLFVCGLAPKETKHRDFICRCDCNEHKTIRGAHLRSGKIRSCGCLQKESRIATKTTHGRTKTPEYKTWLNIRARCYDENHISFKWYGARGIRVCKRWRDSFENFFADMGFRPTPNHSIDRKNNDGDYEPLNCKWSTEKEQQNNRRNNIKK